MHKAGCNVSNGCQLISKCERYDVTTKNLLHSDAGPEDKSVRKILACRRYEIQTVREFLLHQYGRQLSHLLTV
jgi:hypothetical protein